LFRTEIILFAARLSAVQRCRLGVGHWLLCPATVRRQHYALVPLSVCPSVPGLIDPKLRTEGRRKLKLGRKEEAHDTSDPWPHLEVKRSRSPGFLTPWPKISYIIGTGRPNLIYELNMMAASLTCAVTFKLRALIAVQVTTCRGRGIV